jgi:hypothetical protein
MLHVETGSDGNATPSAMARQCAQRQTLPEKFEIARVMPDSKEVQPGGARVNIDPLSS